MGRTETRANLRKMKFDIGLAERVDCTNLENAQFVQMLKNGEKLPEGIFRFRDAEGNDINEFYRICHADLTPEERQEYILLKQYEVTKSIKGYVLFFVILTIISLVSSFIVVLSMFS